MDAPHSGSNSQRDLLPEPCEANIESRWSAYPEYSLSSSSAAAGSKPKRWTSRVGVEYS